MKSSFIFLLGLGMGTVLGILIAPDAGKVTRRRIRDEADKIIDKAMAKKRLKETAAEAAPDVVVVTEERYTI